MSLTVDEQLSDPRIETHTQKALKAHQAVLKDPSLNLSNDDFDLFLMARYHAVKYRRSLEDDATEDLTFQEELLHVVATVFRAGNQTRDESKLRLASSLLNSWQLGFEATDKALKAEKKREDDPIELAAREYEQLCQRQVKGR